MSAPTPEMPAILGHFRIAEKLGAGGMGEVYRARDQHLERDVAIKVLPRGTLADEPARKRFHKEALSLSRVNHPNVATIFDFASEGATDFLVMEYIAGTALSGCRRARCRNPISSRSGCKWRRAWRRRIARAWCTTT